MVASLNEITVLSLFLLISFIIKGQIYEIIKVCGRKRVDSEELEGSPKIEKYG